MLTSSRHRVVATLISVLLTGLAVTAITPPAVAGDAPRGGPGPHSPQGRALAETTVSRTDGTIVREVDLGDVELGRTAGQYRSPVRGVLVTPGPKTASRSQLIVVSHLRFPNCTKNRATYPCPKGTKERRYDRGMTYLGVSLAQRGYSVLIPDLGPLYIGPDLTDPYDQNAGVKKVVSQLVDSVVAANAGKRTRWGRGLRGDVNASLIGLLTHSRSASSTLDLTRDWSSGKRSIGAVMSYGGAYETAYSGERGSTPMIADVPYLGVMGDQDADTDFMTAKWLTHHVGARRKSPALAAVVPGFGHTYINRTLSSAGIDDRICGTSCPTAAEHEAFLAATAAQWFDATLRRRGTSLPLKPASTLPATLSGVPAHWLAVTNRKHSRVFLAGQRGTLRPVGQGARARTCFPGEPMAPWQRGTCPLPPLGVVHNATKVTQVKVTPSSGVVLRGLRTKGVRGVALHLTPTGDRADRASGSPVRVTVRLGSGRRVVVNVPGDEAALVNRVTESSNGIYSIGTVRLTLPSWVATQRVRSIKLTGATQTGSFDVRAIDLLQQRPHRRS